MKLNIPELSLVLLIGPSGSGKSTFAKRHFLPTEVISSDACRALVSDDENNQGATPDAFEVLHLIAAKRLAAGRLTVIDATNVQPGARKPLIELARKYHALPTAIVFNLREEICRERNRQRSDRNFGAHVIHRQAEDLRKSLRGLEREGFRTVHILNNPEQVEAATIERQRLYNNRKEETGPFDIIGDVHGCFEELTTLLQGLGYEVDGHRVTPPSGRKAIFLGDLVDRGPGTPDVLRLVMGMVQEGSALCIPGNHDVKLVRKLRGRDVKVSHGLAETLQQLDQEPPAFREEVAKFLDGLVSHYVLDQGRLVVAHAGLAEAMHGRASGAVRDFCLYGETTGETDEFGLPVRLNWAKDYRGQATVVYGHTPVPEPTWLNRTINIDTGCVFGGALTALRYPEKELVSVPAHRTYCEPVRPIKPEAPALTAQQQHDELLDLGDFTGRRTISTRFHTNVVVPEENAAAALEVMSRFAVNPKWLIYLPPTMSPTQTSDLPGLLEHPAEAFSYFRNYGVSQVVCEEKHMGSRVVVVLGRSEEAIRRRFGITGEGIGVCYTRTGRQFFQDAALEAQVLERLRAAMESAGLWESLKTDWVCLDCELMPWSAKAQDLLLHQYAAVGAAGRVGLSAAVEALTKAAGRGQEVTGLLERFENRAAHVERYVEAYRRYCWPVNGIDDLKLAPFHVLATEGALHTDKDHLWHMQTLARLSEADPGLVVATRHLLVNVDDEASVAEGVAWWEQLTGRGGEGMVIKPLTFISRTSNQNLVQPAVKCRGAEYLRIIYGPEYTEPEHLERLRARGLSTKRSLALREFALGLEALSRFVEREPLRRVHECVFGVLALESEPVDPRL